jgi:hypothetical protein
MKRRVIIVSIVVLTIGFISCQKNDSNDAASLVTTLSTSVAEIIGAQISSITGANEQSVSVEKFDNTIILGITEFPGAIGHMN